MGLGLGSAGHHCLLLLGLLPRLSLLLCFLRGNARVRRDRRIGHRVRHALGFFGSLGPFSLPFFFPWNMQHTRTFHEEKRGPSETD